MSKGRLLTPETLDILAEGMNEFGSLREFFASGKSKAFVDALVRDGVIEQTQISRLTDGTGKLNEAGKDLAESVLRGFIVPDYDVLNACSPDVLNKLDRAIPALARLKARGAGWDMSGVVARALKVINQAQKNGEGIASFLTRPNLVGKTPKPAVQAVALTFANATQKEVQLRFTALANAAEQTTRGQGVMFAQSADMPAKAFIRTFMQTMAQRTGESLADLLGKVSVMGNRENGLTDLENLEIEEEDRLRWLWDRIWGVVSLEGARSAIDPETVRAVRGAGLGGIFSRGKGNSERIEELVAELRETGYVPDDIDTPDAFLNWLLGKKAPTKE